ncbi:MAG: enoyl-CoA hydratase/isomerase family protein [Candidatus Binatia bacterium]
MTQYSTILYQKQRNGVLITLNRAQELNAINALMLDEIDSALVEAEADPEIRGVVITGAGEAFSVGEDISGDDPETAWPYGIPVNTSLNATYNRFRDADRKDILGRQLYRWQYPKPIIAAIGGWCLGAGSSLALSCHLTIAAEDAVFGQPQVRHAANTDFVWVLLAGFKNALRYALTGDHVDAQEALRMGLINQVVPKAELLETCFKFVERVAHVPPETVKINLHISTQGLEMMGLRKAWMLNAELASMARLTKREEFNKRLEEAKKSGGLEAFLRERDAPFQPEPFGPRAKR